jgi:hypothetical protein
MPDEHMPWLEPDDSWQSPPPEAIGGLCRLLCPACGFEYNHHNGARLIDGEDHYRAWMGRGDLMKVGFIGECGHYWSLCIGFHKGELFLYATHDADAVDDSAEV